MSLTKNNKINFIMMHKNPICQDNDNFFKLNLTVL